MPDTSPALVPTPLSPAPLPATVPPTDPAPRPSKASALLAAATTLLPTLEAGRPLDAATLRDAMTAAFGGTDASGAWTWKDAYDAAEAALVLFLRRWGRAMRREAGSPERLLAMLETLATLEPSHTRRSEEQLRFQQFSTPLPLAYASLQAAAVTADDVILEPSAGTGMLAIIAENALGPDRTANLHLNELAPTRGALLQKLFPHSPVTRRNGEAIRDHLPTLRPSLVVMNPPFSVSPGIDRRQYGADLRHLRSAFSTLLLGGRLIAITSRHCAPETAQWQRAFENLDPHVAFSIAVDGHLYARRGTTFDFRLTVLDRGPNITDTTAYDPNRSIANAGELLAAIAADVPPRLPLEVPETEPARTPDLFTYRDPRTPTPGPPTHPARPHARQRSGEPSASFPTKPPRPDPQPKTIAAMEKPRPPRPPSTSRGAPTRSTSPAPRNTRQPSYSPPPWPPSATRHRPTARCCRPTCSPTTCSPMPSSRAWSSPARPTTTTSISPTPSNRTGKTSTRTPPPSMPTKSSPTTTTAPRLSRPPSASGAAGCSATAPAAARDARSPPSSSTNGCADDAGPSGSRPRPNCSRTRAATGRPSAATSATSFR